jgi:hypothetical protein
MKQETVKDIITSIKFSNTILKYLFDYLKNHGDIDELIDDYEIAEDAMDEIRIAGYSVKNDYTIVVDVEFFDEVSENGIGLETYNIDLIDFQNWLEEL